MVLHKRKEDCFLFLSFTFMWRLLLIQVSSACGVYIYCNWQITAAVAFNCNTSYEMSITSFKKCLMTHRYIAEGQELVKNLLSYSCFLFSVCSEFWFESASIPYILYNDHWFDTLFLFIYLFILNLVWTHWTVDLLLSKHFVVHILLIEDSNFSSCQYSVMALSICSGDGFSQCVLKMPWFSHT